MPRSWKEQLANETGSTTVLVAISVVALLGVVALAVDVGMMLDSRAEVQRTADAAALAGASAFMYPPVPTAEIPDSARARARDFVARNPVRGEVIPSQGVEVHVDMSKGTVQVELLRTAIPTGFARIFGEYSFDVGARATARAMTSGTAECIKPLMIPDPWWDRNGNGIYDKTRPSGESTTNGFTYPEYYDPLVTGFGNRFRDPGNPGYTSPTYWRDWGRPVTLKVGSNDQTMRAGWYFAIRLGTSTGSSDYRAALSSACTPHSLSINDQIWSEPGNMAGPTKQGVEDAIAADPNARWVDGVGVVGSSFPNVHKSPRMFTIPLFAPTEQIPGGTSAPMTVTNLATFFVTGMQGNDVVGRWVRVRPVPDKCWNKGNCRASMMYLRLIQ